MASPAYAWFYDENGKAIEGNVAVDGRQGSVEVFTFDYGVEMPVDRFNGVTNGTRAHDTATLTKAFDASSPILFQAACDGRTLKQALIRWYRINEEGKEEPYFSHALDDVKVVSYQQCLSHVKETANSIRSHEDIIALRFGKITMKHLDGNIEASDTWIKRS